MIIKFLGRLFYLPFLTYSYGVDSLTIYFNSGILFQKVLEDEIDKTPLLDFGVGTNSR